MAKERQSVRESADHRVTAGERMQESEEEEDMSYSTTA